MVLGGQSAGGMGTSMYAYTYPDDPIVRGLLIESGEAMTTVPDDGTQWASLVEALGCQSSDSKEELTCMQRVDAYILKRTLSPHELTPLSSPPEARPTVDNVTYFGLAEYAALGAAGKFARIVSEALRKVICAHTLCGYLTITQPSLRGITNNEGNSLTEFTPEGLVNQTLADWLTDIAFNCPSAAEAG